MEDRREIALTSLARRQQGVWPLAQALECGFTRPAVRRRVISGKWQEVDARVYRAAQAMRPSDRQMLMARVFATGGVASGRSAAALYGWLPFPEAPEVTVMRRARRNSHTAVRSTEVLPAVDVTTADRIPATTPARTLIDLGGVLPLKRFEDLFDEVIVTGKVTLRRLESRARALACSRRGGCAIVLALIAESNPEILQARNGAEAKVLRAISQLGLPPPRVNFPVDAGGTTRFLDFAWEEHMVFVELDGLVAHSKRDVFEDDRVRQNDLVALGWRPYRITWNAFERSPRAAFSRVIEALNEPCVSS